MAAVALLGHSLDRGCDIAFDTGPCLAAHMTDMTTFTARPQPRTDSGRYGSFEHSEPDVSIDAGGETAPEAAQRGAADARAGRAPNPQLHLDEYMAGYDTELFDDRWRAARAVTVLHEEAPLGATAAHLFVNEHTGQLAFSRYVDRHGRTLSTGRRNLNSVLAGTSPDEFAARAVEESVDGERRFTVHLDT